MGDIDVDAFLVEADVPNIDADPTDIDDLPLGVDVDLAPIGADPLDLEVEASFLEVEVLTYARPGQTIDEVTLTYPP